MAQILIRNLEKPVVVMLKSRAAGHGRSLQAEVKELLVQAANIAPMLSPEAVLTKIEEIRKRSKKTAHKDSAFLVREDRGR